MSATPVGATAAVPLTPPQFRAAIAAVFLLILLGALDQMTVSVALPTIASSLGSFDGMAWVISGYMIATTVVTPLYGRFGDMYGRTIMLSVALAIFVLGSIACATATSLPALVIARLVQGAGGGGMLALAQGVVADIVALRDRGRFQGYVSIVWASASVIGPTVGGVLTQYLSWRWIFWVNLPMSLLAWVLVTRSMRALPGGRGRQTIDWLGAILLTGGLITLMVPITRLGQGVSPADLGNWGWMLLAVALLAVFWRHQRRSGAPILPIELLHDPVVLRGIAILFICYFLFVALCLLVPLRLQLVAGWGATRSGAFLMWLTLAVPASVFVGGRWMTWKGRIRPLQRIGTLMSAAAMGVLAFIDPAVAWVHAAGLALLGAGIGWQMPTSLLMVQNAVPRKDVGTATAVTVLFRALGGAIGIAVLSSVVFAVLQDGGAAGSWKGAGALAKGGVDPALRVSDIGFRAALLVGMGLSLVSVWVGRGLPDTRLHS